ncbi:hypothetical protein WN51_08379 [Melipona quadrifasciata]|uniref:Uncharacterized protein n=1 Tax=Melipona quadrifasciata TaxID=166423 RepID=A0A0N0U7B1_9HYME|nr:hypothetical protein WN51_08379 [Melipona quadrifasciata]
MNFGRICRIDKYWQAPKFFTADSRMQIQVTYNEIVTLSQPKCIEPSEMKIFPHEDPQSRYHKMVTLTILLSVQVPTLSKSHVTLQKSDTRSTGFRGKLCSKNLCQHFSSSLHVYTYLEAMSKSARLYPTFPQIATLYGARYFGCDWLGRTTESSKFPPSELRTRRIPQKLHQTIFATCKEARFRQVTIEVRNKCTIHETVANGTPGEMAAFERYVQTERKTTRRAACDAEVALVALFYGTRGTSPPGLAFIYSVANERWPGKGPQRIARISNFASTAIEIGQVELNQTRKLSKWISSHGELKTTMPEYRPLSVEVGHEHVPTPV